MNLADLTRLMTESLTERLVKSTEWKLVGIGRLLDEVDIKEKHKNKPQEAKVDMQEAHWSWEQHMAKPA